MLKLYYSPGACSLVPHIALEEAGVEFTALRIPIAEGGHLTPEYLAINPHARLPSLETDRGVITENVAVVNFIADRFGAAGSVPRGDPYAAARCNELLGWFALERPHCLRRGVARRAVHRRPELVAGARSGRAQDTRAPVRRDREPCAAANGWWRRDSPRPIVTH